VQNIAGLRLLALTVVDIPCDSRSEPSLFRYYPLNSSSKEGPINIVKLEKQIYQIWLEKEHRITDIVGRIKALLEKLS
jgi:hypothetical protein